MAFLHFYSQLICPHCGSTANQSVLYAHAESRAVREGVQLYWEPREDRFQALVSCSVCQQPWLLVLAPRPMVQGKPVCRDSDRHLGFLNRIRPAEVVFESGGPSQVRYTITGDRQNGQDISQLYQVVAQYPEGTLQRPERELLPEALNEALDELQTALPRPRLAVITCRRALEIATGSKLENPKATLAERIGQLQAAGVLTREMADWARALKDILNGKTHEGSAPSAELATEVVDFTRLLIDLIYVYPARIARLKHQPTPPESA